MKRSRVDALAALLVGVGISGTSACATADAARPRDDPRVENDVLRERVARLERRLVDVDAKVATLLDRQGIAGAGRRASVSSGSAPMSSFSRPGSSSSTAASAPAPPHDEREAPLVGIGTRAVDLASNHSGDEDDGVVIEADGDAAARVTEAQARPRQGSREAPRAERERRTGASDDDGDATQGYEGKSAPEIYAWGQARIKEGRTLEAITAFEDVTERFPTHKLADNSIYWIGWCHQKRGDARLAIEVWQRLPLRFPNSPKIADALFGMASAHEALAEPAIAETLYDEIATQYPKAEKAPLARQALARLRPR